MIKVERFSDNLLTKYVYEFMFTHYGDLKYQSYFTYNRSSKKEKWADEVKKNVLSYKEWLEKNDKEDDHWSEEEYRKYRDKLNPVLQKTRQGKTKMSGVCADIKHLPVCPDDVAKEAVKLYRQREVKVFYKP